MSGLLLKDFYTLKKNAMFMLVLVAIFAVVPVYSLNLFASGFSALMPMYAMSYDERAKWDRLAAAMPYGRRTVVFGRYALGLICIASVAVLMFAGAFVRSMIAGTAFNVQELALMSAVGLCMQALVMPFLFKLGVEKGRMVYMVAVFLMAASVTALGAISSDADLLGGAMRSLGGVLLLGALLLNALSAWLSVRFYQNRAL